MQSTVEIRWFIPIEPPPVPSVFGQAQPPAIRTDWYVPAGSGTGVKLREGNFDVKVLLRDLGVRDVGGRRGSVEEWKKWIFKNDLAEPVPDELLRRRGWIGVTKARSLLVFSFDDGPPKAVKTWPQSGCQFEWTRVTLDRETWLTIGLEAFGPSPNLERLLEETASVVLPKIPSDLRLDEDSTDSYPAWLARICANQHK